ncbi:hypothetical protein NN561_017679 [Cricetulus griseus]
MRACTPISGDVLYSPKRREDRIAPSDTFPEVPPRVARALGTLEHLSLEPQEETLGGRAGKSSRSPPREMWRGRSGAPGPEVLETGSEASFRLDHMADPSRAR